jgi:hypothetical protein
MSIWGRRDSEPLAEEAPEGQAGEARESQAGAQATQEPAAEHQPGEPAPAFWRAQGQPSAPLERDPADAPPPAYGDVPPAGPAAEATAGTDAPVPVLTGVVVDGEAAGRDPASVAHEPAMTEAEAPVVAEPLDEAQEPVVTEAEAPVVAEPLDEAQEPVVTEAQEPAGTGTGQPAAPAIAPQRWSEILASFVDDPRGSVKMAADAVDEAIDEFVNSLRARQRALAATWQGAEGDTEQLRTALREYRRLGQRVQQLDLGGKTGA